MKLFKRFLVVMAVLLAAAIVAASVGFYMLKRRPSYYHSYKWEGEQRSIGRHGFLLEPSWRDHGSETNGCSKLRYTNTRWSPAPSGPLRANDFVRVLQPRPGHGPSIRE